MKFIWQIWSKTPRPGSLGHGICIFDQKRQADDRIIAFVEGYAWNDGCSDTVVVYTIEPDSITTIGVLQELRKILEGCLKPNRKLPQGMLSPRIEAWLNA
jgi:hypothetical protein